jgi:hypothetical protein
MFDSGKTSATARLLVPAVVAGLVTLGACSVRSAATGAGVPAGPADPPAQVTADEERLLWDAEQLLLRDCMAEHGFKYWVAPRNPVAEDRDFPYVVDDMGWARRHGYGSDVLEQITRLRAQNPNRRYLEALPAERRRAAFAALNGEGPRPGAVARRPDELEARLPTGGVVRRSAVSCTSQAQRRLYGDLPTWYRVTKVVQNLNGVRKARVIQDPRFTAAVSAWSACMRQRGHPYADPREARAKTTLNGSAGPRSRKAREAEVGTAVAEAACAHAAGLSAVARDLDEKYGRALDEQYRSDFTTERRMQRQALNHAAMITAAA